MTTSYIKIPPFEERVAQGLFMNSIYFRQFTLESRFIKLFPGDTHQKWGEIIDAWQAGVKVRITRVKNNLSSSGASYKVGSVHFIPMSKVSFAYVTEEEAKGQSCTSYNEKKNLTWDEFVAQAEGE